MLNGPFRCSRFVVDDLPIRFLRLARYSTELISFRRSRERLFIVYNWQKPKLAVPCSIDFCTVLKGLPVSVRRPDADLYRLDSLGG